MNKKAQTFMFILSTLLLILFAYLFFAKIIQPDMKVDAMGFQLGERSAEIDRFATVNYFELKNIAKDVELNINSISGSRYKVKDYKMFDSKLSKTYVLEYIISVFEKEGKYFVKFKSVHPVYFVMTDTAITQDIMHEFDISVSKEVYDRLSP